MPPKRKATDAPAGQSPTKRVTRLNPGPPLGSKIVIPRLPPTTPRRVKTPADNNRSVVDELEASSRHDSMMDSHDELDLLPSRTRSGKTRLGTSSARPERRTKPPAQDKAGELDTDTSTPPSSPTRRSRTTRPSPLVPPFAPKRRGRFPTARSPSPAPISPAKKRGRPPQNLPQSSTAKLSPTKTRGRPLKTSPAIETPSKRRGRAPQKRSPSPSVKLSPAKRSRRPPKSRTPSPVPDSEYSGTVTESREPSPPIASSSHVSEPGLEPAEEQISPFPLDLNPSFHASSTVLNAQKREILRATQNPPNLVDDDDDSTNRITSKQLIDLLRGTVVRGEGNSCLLLGPRGSGKTSIVDRCIADLPEQPIILRLCGWSQQTDRLAMREIAYQLGQQTGRSFLAPEEGTEQTDEDPNSYPEHSVPVSLPPSTHLPALISMLHTLSRPTIVILDAFDLFAQHPRQSLLYCLLDTVQSCRAGSDTKGIVVIGMTTRVDTINLLEKRVKSRFSGRMFSTAPPSQSQDWVQLANRILCSRIKNHRELDESGDWHRRWEAGVESFLQNETTLSVLKETFSVTKDVRVLARLLTCVAVQLSPLSPIPTSNHLEIAAANQRSRPQFTLLHALPYPSICLLIACVHCEIAGHPTFTFEMLYERIRDQIRISTSAPVQLKGSSIGMPQCSRAVLISAFESLVSAKVIAAAAASSANVAREFVKFRAVASREDVKRAVQTKNDFNLTRWFSKAGCT
ncbi:origin recognition complex subunit 4 C-terminus-domain-containing protein [Mycena pura]|uniref:Origin recognition complex subunit 4 C-terminus-domain-containing protein n=1 Tax=Mycena pura TaxID=153505 RepID=A0AAD7E5A1_9AGAR|nr:origin recognition complex subunit 4 C-terminus-domain-containing protein [Mycena pura]